MMIAEDAVLHRMQRAFRQVLNAFAHPGLVYEIELTAENQARPASLTGAQETAVRLFVDQAVTFAVVDAEEDTLASYLTSETHAVRVPVPRANFIVIPHRADSRLANRAVFEAAGGTLLSPEAGATVILGCMRLSQENDHTSLYKVAVSGPGVKEVNAFYVDRADWALARTARKDEFPCGIEILLVDNQGNVVAIPRSSQIELSHQALDAVCDSRDVDAQEVC